jgi:hypothetical protein
MQGYNVDLTTRKNMFNFVFITLEPLLLKRFWGFGVVSNIEKG